jgi:hypothetical protein
VLKNGKQIKKLRDAAVGKKALKPRSVAGQGVNFEFRVRFPALSLRIKKKS